MSILDKAKRETARWIILRILDAGRPGDLDEALVQAALHDALGAGGLTQAELRRELDYLEGRKLIDLVRREVWRAKLTRYGVDLVEYTVEAEPGIARPPRW